MDKCPVCNINAPYGENELCEGCMNNMLLGGPSFTFVPDSNFLKEIGIGEVIKKVHGKSVNSDEESGWIERQIELEKEKGVEQNEQN